MRHLAIGDIHGCAAAFDALLAAVRPGPGDRLVALGDYVDRGPDSKGVLDRLIALYETGWLVPLRGNHDVLMLDARKGPQDELEWLLCGGRATLASYAAPGTEGGLKDVPAGHWRFLEKCCLDWYETETHFFVHANVCPDVPLADQPLFMLHWEKLDGSSPHESGKIMVCGHTQQRGGAPLDLGHAVCIDTWVYGGGWLTCLDVTSGRIWQANQRGEVRTGRLGGVFEPPKSA